MCYVSDVNRPRDHVEASSESLQSPPAAFPTHGHSAPAGTSTNGAYAASWPTTHHPCSGNWTSNNGSGPDIRAPSHNCSSHVKASPHYPTTPLRPPSNGSSSGTEASADGTHLGAPTYRSHTSNSASNHGPHATVGASTSESCTRARAPACGGAQSRPVPPPSKPPVLPSTSEPRPFTDASKATRTGSNPRPGVRHHPQSSPGSASPGQRAAPG